MILSVCTRYRRRQKKVTYRRKRGPVILIIREKSQRIMRVQEWNINHLEYPLWTPPPQTPIMYWRLKTRWGKDLSIHLSNPSIHLFISLSILTRSHLLLPYLPSFLPPSPPTNLLQRWQPHIYDNIHLEYSLHSISILFDRSIYSVYLSCTLRPATLIPPHCVSLLLLWRISELTRIENTNNNRMVSRIHK